MLQGEGMYWYEFYYDYFDFFLVQVLCSTLIDKTFCGKGFVVDFLAVVTLTICLCLSYNVLGHGSYLV